LFRLLRLMSIIVLAFSIGRCSHAADYIVLEKEPFELKRGQSRLWKLPPVETKGRLVVLEFEARMDSASLAGSMFYLQVELNGEQVEGAPNRLRSRLLNKPLKIEHQPPLWWYARGTGWRIVYAPDFECAKESYYGEEAYRFVIDITDLLRNDGENTLRLTHRISGYNFVMVIRNLRLGFRPARSKGAEPSDGYALRGVEQWRVDVSPAGAVVLRVGKRTFEIVSAFSRPGGGWHAFGKAAAPGDAVRGWSVKAERVADGEWRVSAKSHQFTVSREVRLNRGRIEIADSITNLTSADIGFAILDEAMLGEYPVPVVHICGNPDPSVTEKFLPQNPTVFAPLGDFSIGMVVEDDVVRSQAIQFYSDKPPRIGFRAERLVVPARETYTTRWAVYPMIKADYYDFINRIRTDWEAAPFTIQGPYVWGFRPEKILAMPDEELASAIKRMNVFAFSTGGGWVDWLKKEKPPRQIGFGAGVLEPEFADLRNRMKKAAEKIHRIAPDVKVIYYCHFFFNEPEPKPERFKDCWITTASGNRFVNGWRGRFTASGGIFPTLDNSFGKEFFRVVDTLMDEYGADGIYLDETTQPSGLGDPITYNRWDGHTAILNPRDFSIERKVGSLYLLCRDYKLALIEHIRKRGGWMLGNGQPVCLALNRERFPRFTETHTIISRAYEGHLYTPLAYGTANPTMEMIRERLALGMLYCRVGLRDRTDAIAHFFPITILEIHAGWVKGKERIVTMKSGTYSWEDKPVKARIYPYDSNGTALQPIEKTSPRGEFKVQVPEGGLCIIERID